MIIISLVLLISILRNVCEGQNQYLIYRLVTPRNPADRLVLTNFLGQPGIDVLNMNPEYIDVKIPKSIESVFQKLGLDRNKIDFFQRRILNKEYYYRIFAFETRREIPNSDQEDYSYDYDYNQNEIERNCSIPFEQYLPYDAIVSYLLYLERLSSKRIFVKPIGETVNKRKIYSVIIKSGIANTTCVFIEGGTAGREWISITMALYVIYQVGYNIDLYPELVNLDWIIVPVVNPDGYEYSLKNVKYRMWRKNRNCPQECELGDCGVDIDRNFPYFYAGFGASATPCSSFYMGPTSLSERESAALQSIMMSNRDTIKLYIGFRSFGPYILHPWGISEAAPHPAEAQLIALGKIGTNAMNAAYEGKLKNYTVERYSSVKYPAGGNIMDYAVAGLRIKYAYIIDIRRGEDEKKGYMPEFKEILPIVQECFQGVRAMAKTVYAKFPPPKANIRRIRNKRKRRIESSSCVIYYKNVFYFLTTLTFLLIRIANNNNV